MSHNHDVTKTVGPIDYAWRPKGLPIKAQGIAIDPYLAFKLFVLPGLNDPNWIEDGSW